ncbi:MAG: glycosyltransferase [Candidatus Bathyarchaeia archaeon]
MLKRTHLNGSSKCLKTDDATVYSTALPPVSIIVSTFNEANVIERKIDNLSKLNYPKELLEVIVYDDASIDQTSKIANKTLTEKNLYGKVISNPNRLGLNRSLNIATAQAKHNLICVTDSDVLLEEDALKNAVQVLQQYTSAGGVTGHVQPVFENQGIAQQSETSYRGFYHASMLAESFLHSAFPGNGPLIVFDKSKVPYEIPNDYGSTDGNIAINVIRKGLRFLYVPNSIIYEPSAESLEQQKMQKIRRAMRLLQVFIRNRDIAFNRNYGNFGRLIFPLKLLMFVLCPVLLFVGMSLLGIAVILSQNLLLYLFTLLIVFTFSLTLVSMRMASLLSSFFFHQFYLLIGLFFSFKKSVYWKTIDRTTAVNFIGGKE